MKKALQRVVKRAVWEVRFNTRLLFYDRGGALLQPFVDWEDRQFFPRWGYDGQRFELANPERFVRFSMQANRATADVENLELAHSFHEMQEKAVHFLEAVGDALEVPWYSRVGQRLLYLVETRRTFEEFQRALSRQLTRLEDFESIDACESSDLSVVWVSQHGSMRVRWNVGPLALKEFPGWFRSKAPLAEPSSREKRFFPDVALLIDVDAFQEGQVQTSAVEEFWGEAFKYVDAQALRLADSLREE